MIALLGLAQIPLGLTLYGSPLALFVLYALAVFVLLVIYFILTYLRERRGGTDYDSRYSYGTGSSVEQRRPSGQSHKSGRSGNLIKGALAGAGLYALVNRFRRRPKDRDDGPEVVGSRRHSGSFIEDEKYSQYSGRSGIWEDRLLRIAAPIGAAGLVTRFFDRRYRDRDSDIGDYRPPPSGATPTNDARFSASRPAPGGAIPINQALPSVQHPLNQPSPSVQHHPPPPPSSLSYTSVESASRQDRRGHGLRDGLATLGVVGLAKNIFNRRRDRKEDQRLADEQEARMHGQHFTGDGRPPRHHQPGESTLSTDTSSIGGHPQTTHGAPPVTAVVYPARPSQTGHGRDQSRVEELPLGGVPRYGAVPMPNIPPDPQGLFHPDSSGSEAYIGDDGRNHWRHHAGRDAASAGIAGGATGLAAAEASSRRQDRHDGAADIGATEASSSRRNRQDEVTNIAATDATSRRRDRRDRRQSTSAGDDSAATPPTPVSVKVKMHNGGRAVTLRRLPEAEAAAEREARRLSRNQGRRRGDSVSSLSGTDGSGERFRRNQFQDRQQAEAMRIESERLAAARNQTLVQPQNQPVNVPPPPPIFESSIGARPGALGSVGSPQGTYDGNTTEASADYANNRRRRRAERGQKQAREARAGKTVEFE